MKSGIVSSRSSQRLNLGSLLETSLRRLARVRGVVSLGAALLLFCAVGAQGQAPALEQDWYQLVPSANPSPRSTTAITYDAAHGQVVMFGGYNGSFLNDTWLWNGTTWTQTFPQNSPSARSNVQMVYDPARGNVVLFGGLTSVSTRADDTWIWDGTNWTQQFPAISPTGGRASASMVFDPATNNVVLFGGLNSGGMTQGDTWVWNGTNWTNVTPSNPANSPTGGREGASMAYDAAAGNVVLFGGSDEYGNDQNDTWTWDGSNWTQQSPGSSPAARDGAAMAYDPALGQVVLFGGEQNPHSPNYINDTWVWNGTTWTNVSPPNSPGARYAYNQLTYDAAQNQLILFGGSNTSTTYDDTWAFGPPQNFGSINVCQSGAPAPCSNTLALTYNFPTTTTIGSILVVTQGATNLDFTQANGGSCAGQISAGNSCILDVTFAPTAPGVRQGAVELFDSSNHLLVTTLIYGVGQGPAAAFGPATTYISTSDITYSSQVTAVPNLSVGTGMTTDAAGNLYQASGSNLFKVVPGGTPTAVATGLDLPEGVAIDGAGSLYVANAALGGNGEVVKLAPGCTSATASCAVVLYAPSSLPGPFGIAVDGLGDVFISKATIGAFEIPAGCSNSSCYISLYSPGGSSSSGGIGLDAAGDLFVTDSGLKQVVEIPAGCTSAVCQTLVGTGWVGPQSVAVDAAGDVIVADPDLTIGAQDDAGGVVEVPAGCTGPACQILLWSGGAPDPFDVAVNAAGQIFIDTDANTPVYEINQSQPPQVSFGTTTEAGTVSSPLPVTFQNIGNQALNITGLSIGSPFDQTLNQNDNPADCGAGSFTLTLGQICALNISFEPPAPNAQSYSADVAFADNSLNLPYSPTQQIPLAGTATGGIATDTVAVTELGSGAGTVTSTPTGISCSQTAGGTSSGTCSTNLTASSQVTLTAAAGAGSVFLGWGTPCSGTSPTCTFTVSATYDVSATFSQQSFGSVNVCAGGNTSGCTGSTIPVTFNFTGNTAVSQILAFTLGSTGLDFTAPNSGQCINSFTSGQSCTVSVTFKPTAPGLRRGAVELLDSLGNVLLALPVSGIGQGPEVAFSPGNQTTVSAVGMNYPVGLALDGAGDLYIANYGNGNGGTQPASHPGYVLKVTPGGVQTTVLSAYTSAPGQAPYPVGVAVDGAGNLFIVDLYLPYAVKVTPSGVQTTLGSGLNYPVGIALDGAGDVFIGDQNKKRVVEITPAGVQTTVPFTGLQQPWGVAVDAAGDVFVADGGSQSPSIVPPSVQEITPSGVQTTVPTTGLGQPYDLAVDAAGDVYIADAPTGRLLQVTPGGIQSNVSPTILNYPSGVTVDAAGDVFIADQGAQTVYEINGSSPLVSFDTGLGYQSPDSPLSVQNVGNQTLSGTVGPVSGAYIDEDTVNSNCNSFTLAPSASCVNNYYTPSTAPLGLYSGTVQATDNSLNGNPATQTINFTGLSYGPTEQVAVAAGGTGGGLVYSNLTGLNCNMNAGVASGPTCSYGFTSGFTVTLYAIPSNGSAFTSWGGACASVGTGGPSGGTCNLFIPESATNVTANFTSTASVAVPNVVGSTQVAATTAITTSTLVVGTVTTQYSDTVPSGSVISESPTSGTMVSGGTPVNLVVSSGTPPASDQLALENNYFVTGDYASAGVTLRGASIVNGMATGTITIPSGTSPGSVPDGADIVAAYLYWQAIENTTSPSSTNATFLGYSVTGLQIGSDVPSYSDGTYTGTLRAYRADVNNYFPISAGPNPVRSASGNFTVSLSGGGPMQQIPEGASLVVIYRVMSPNFPLKSVVLYNGLVTPTATTGTIPQAVQGFYDAVGGANGTGEVTNIYTGPTGADGTGPEGWNNSSNSQTLGQSNQYIDTLNTANAYAAVVLSTPVNNGDGDGILDVWKANQGYTDVNTGLFVSLPGAKAGEKDLFVQFDYMCSAFAPDGVTCDLTQPNQYPSPDAQGNDPLAMVTQAFLNSGVHLHLKPGNAIPENTYTCTDPNPANGSLCEFPSTTADPQPGVVAWNGGVELSKVWPANFNACTTSPSTASCTPRFPFGQKDSYHYVLFGYSLAIPAWNSWFGSLTAITVSSTQTTIVTTGLGSTCPSRVTISGVQGNPALNGVYNTTGCDSALTTIYLSTPSGATTGWTYPNPNALPEPVIGITSGKVTSISGYSNVGGSDSVVSLGLWAQNSNQDMSKPATVIAGTLFHELGHTLGLTHGGRYYDTPGSYVPTFEANCKPNYQSSMNYLFQLDGVGSNGAVAYSNQTLTELFESSLTQVNQLSDTDTGFVGAATFPTSSWYTPTAPSSTTSAATMHCDGSPLDDDTNPAYRVNGSITSSPGWSDGQNITFDEPNSYSRLRGYNDQANIDLRQVGATSDELASLANATSYSSAGVTFGGGGGVTFGGGGGVTFGGGGGVTFGGGGGVTFGGGGGVTFGGGGGVTFGGGGGVTFGGGGGVTFGGGGGATTELDYPTANSVVRPPAAPTYSVQGNSVQVNWMAPAFGVVQTYTISRSVIVPPSTVPGPAVVIGSVSGVGGFPPATTFTDTAPPTNGTLIYTIATTLLPVPIDLTSRSSAPSAPAVLALNQAIVLGPLPSSVPLSSSAPSTLTVTATAESNSSGSGLSANMQLVSFTTSGQCSAGSSSINGQGVSSATVTLNSIGSCTITASQAGDSTTVTSPPAYSAATPVSGTFAILQQGSNTQSQTITFGTLPTVQYGSKPFTVSAASSSALAVMFSGPPSGQPCSVSGTTVTITGAGLCKVTASQSGGQANNKTYSAASVTQSFNISTAPLTVTAISLTSVYGQPLPSLNASLGVTYNLSGFVNNDSSSVVTGAPSLSTTATSSSPAGTYPISVSTGTLAAANYSFLYVPGTLTITTGPAVSVSPSSIAFGTVSQGSITTKTITVTNIGTAPLTVSTPILSIVKGGNSNEFVAVNLCLTPLAAGKSCTITIAFLAGPYYTPQTATLEIMDNAPGSPQPVTLSATVLQPQTITLTNVPSSAAYNSSFTVAPTGGGSGNPVTFTASGSCSLLPGSATYTMTSGTGTCSVIANQAGNTIYAAAAQVTKTVKATLATQTITFTTGPPSSAAYKTSFTVAASAYSGSPATANGNPVTFTSSGACSNSGAIYTMTGATGTCSVIANQAGNSNYSAATQVTKTVSATVAAQTITFTPSLPSSAAYKTSFTVAASASSGLAVTFTSSGACSNSGATYTMTSSTGICSVIASQAGNSDYSAAPKITKTVTATLAAQAITFTTNPSSSAAYKSSFTVAATATSGLAVTFTSSGSCSSSGATYTMTSGMGTCSVIANQAGNSNYAAAPQFTKTVTATLAAQAITFTTSPPSSAANKSSFKVAATGGASGIAVIFTSSGSCSNSGATYTMTSATGTCSVIANQAGNSNYAAAPQFTKTVTAKQ